jgi:hypothetical protein
MRTVVLKRLALVVFTVVAVVASETRPARAYTPVRINTPGTACSFVVSGSWSRTDLPAWQLTRYSYGGVSNPDSVAHDIICPIVSGLSTGGNPALYVDGGNTAYAQTTCTVFQNTFYGATVASSSIGFPNVGASFSIAFGFTFNDVYDYFTLRCTLAPGDHSIIRGATNLQ